MKKYADFWMSIAGGTTTSTKKEFDPKWEMLRVNIFFIFSQSHLTNQSLDLWICVDPT
jgi:hypothetical protein